MNRPVEDALRDLLTAIEDNPAIAQQLEAAVEQAKRTLNRQQEPIRVFLGDEVRLIYA